MKKIFKRLGIIFLFFAIGMGGCVFWLSPRPPKETALVQNFKEHRAVFEQLRRHAQR